MSVEEESLALRIHLSVDEVTGLYAMTMTLPEVEMAVTSSGANLVEAIEKGAAQMVEQLTAKGYEVTLDDAISAIGGALEDGIQQAASQPN